MNNSRLVYSTETGKLCPSCQKPVSECICKKKKSGSQTNIKYDGIMIIRVYGKYIENFNGTRDGNNLNDFYKGNTERDE